MTAKAYLVDITPVPKPRMTQSDRWKKRPAVVRYYRYKDSLLYEALAQGFYLTDEIELVFGLPMPKSWSKKKKAEMNGKPHQAKPDIDNLSKAVMDALLDEDSHIWSLRASKFWSDKGSLVIKTTEG
jgi:Holliday junction resolvase RusA-like endonuclease